MPQTRGPLSGAVLNRRLLSFAYSEIISSLLRNEDTKAGGFGRAVCGPARTISQDSIDLVLHKVLKTYLASPSPEQGRSGEGGAK